MVLITGLATPLWKNVKSESVLSNSMVEMVTTCPSSSSSLHLFQGKFSCSTRPRNAIWSCQAWRVPLLQLRVFFGGHTSAKTHDYQVSHGGTSNPHILPGQSFLVARAPLPAQPRWSRILYKQSSSSTAFISEKACLSFPPPPHLVFIISPHGI